MKQIGIWLDKEKAHIVTLYDGQTSIDTVFSNIENLHEHDGSGTWSKNGPNEAILEKKSLEREKQELKRFFKNLVLEIKNADKVVLFGPAETAKKFNDELLKCYKNLAIKVKTVSKVGAMTKKQIIAWVKDSYRHNSGR